MSPARSHVEQSRNTLLFASCAKEVTTNARVNLVVSEKALVKQLQRELARMENELKNLGSGSASSDFTSMLKQKEELIEKMENQIKELTWQRDLAHSRVANLLKSSSEERSLRMDENSVASSMDIGNPFLLEADLRRRSSDSRGFAEPIMSSNLGKSNELSLFDNSEEDYFLLDDSMPQFSGHDPCQDWEEIAQRTNQEREGECKEVRCVETKGHENKGKQEREETRESLDVVVDKKAISEVLSPRKQETLPAKPSSREYVEHEKSSTGDVKPAETGETKLSPRSETEDGKLSLRKIDAEFSPDAYLEGNEQSSRNVDKELRLSVEGQENQQSLEKEDKELSLSAEKLKQSPKKINGELRPSAEQIEQFSKNEDRELITSLKQTEQYTEKENTKLSSVSEQKKQSPETVEVVEFTPSAKPENDDSRDEERNEASSHQAVYKEHDESHVDQRERQVTLTDHIDNSTYEALTRKMKEMQKTIEYLMSVHAAEQQQQSPSFEAEYTSPAYAKLKRSKSCRDILLSSRSPLWIENSEYKKSATPALFPRDLSGRTKEPAWRLMELKEAAAARRAASNSWSISFDTESTISSTSIDEQSVKDNDADNGSGFQEFLAGLKEMAKQHQSSDSIHELDNAVANEGYHGITVGSSKTKTTKPDNSRNSDVEDTNGTENPRERNADNTNSTKDQAKREHTDDSEEETANKEMDSVENTKNSSPEKLLVASGPYSSGPSDFEKQQKKIIELWAVCNVPLVHRTYFFVLFKGDPSDFVYMEVELRRLSFLKDSVSHDSDTSRKQSVKALAREKEWLAKQIPKKFPRNQREELYRKWGIELSTKQRSLQVAHSLWTNTQDTEHIKESASLVAKLVGFAEPNQTPKEMFGLALSTRTVNMKSSGWRFTKSFSGLT